LNDQGHVSIHAEDCVEQLVYRPPTTEKDAICPFCFDLNLDVL
jgi:hypothetical protein